MKSPFESRFLILIRFSRGYSQSFNLPYRKFDQKESAFGLDLSEGKAM
jgi:hypothetical protein